MMKMSKTQPLALARLQEKGGEKSSTGGRSSTVGSTTADAVVVPAEDKAGDEGQTEKSLANEYITNLQQQVYFLELVRTHIHTCTHTTSKHINDTYHVGQLNHHARTHGSCRAGSLGAQHGQEEGFRLVR